MQFTSGLHFIFGKLIVTELEHITKVALQSVQIVHYDNNLSRSVVVKTALKVLLINFWNREQLIFVSNTFIFNTSITNTSPPYPWKHQNIRFSLVFPGVIEMEHRIEMY